VYRAAARPASRITRRTWGRLVSTPPWPRQRMEERRRTCRLLGPAVVVAQEAAQALTADDGGAVVGRHLYWLLRSSTGSRRGMRPRAPQRCPTGVRPQACFGARGGALVGSVRTVRDHPRPEARGPDRYEARAGHRREERQHRVEVHAARGAARGRGRLMKNDRPTVAQD
jgi:hypothetical protein